MEIKDFLKQAGIFLKDEGINALKSYINEECRSARENQKYNEQKKRICMSCYINFGELIAESWQRNIFPWGGMWNGLMDV